MKLAIAAIALLSLATPVGVEAGPGVNGGELTLEVSSMARGGSLAVAVYRDAASFRRGERPVATQTAPRTGEVTSVAFTGLAPGRYAVAAYHDLDGDGALTLWPFGLPKEPYGFSRDARGRFGPPAFDNAAFELSPAGARQAFALR